MHLNGWSSSLVTRSVSKPYCGSDSFGDNSFLWSTLVRTRTGQAFRMVWLGWMNFWTNLGSWIVNFLSNQITESDWFGFFKKKKKNQENQQLVLYRHFKLSIQINHTDLYWILVCFFVFTLDSLSPSWDGEIIEPHNGYGSG